MGGSQSAPRKVTVENPDDTIIKITENVVERLQDSNKDISSTRVREQPTTSPNYQVSDSASGAVFITSQQIRREVNEEIEKNNAYWENRLKILRDGHRNISTELQNEYNKAVKEVNQTLGTHLASSSDGIGTCKQNQNNIVQCYTTNKNQPLLCSEEVQKFNDCVSSKMNLMLKAK